MTEPKASTETAWTRARDGWVRALAEEDLRAVIAKVNSDSPLDENDGDRTERAEALEWLASRGERGCEWGLAGAAARRLGLWSEEAP